MTLGQALSDLLLWAVGGLATVFAGVGGLVKRNRDRSLRNAKRLEGDDENPNDEGLMDIAHETREKVDRMEARMEREHREVMSKLDEISDGEYEAGD